MKHVLLALLFLFSKVSLAGTGDLFNVSVNGSTLGITPVANHLYPNAGIKITSSGFTLTNAGTECKPDANGYCLFSVSPTAPATITVTGSGSLNIILCLNGAGPMSCQNYDNLPVGNIAKIAKTAYVTNNSGTPTVSFCAINQSTGLLQNCQDAGQESVLSGISPQGIALNNTSTVAYVSNRQSMMPYVYQCSIAVNGTFNNCAPITIITPSGYQPNRGDIALNSANTIAYLIDLNSGSPRVLACPLVSGSISGNCSDTGATGLNVNSAGIVLNNANTTAYIGNYTNGTVTVCNVSGTTFSGCIVKTSGGSITFNKPTGVALNNTQTTLYIGDYGNGAVYGCSTTANGGSSFSNCFTAATIPNASGVTLNAANTFAYVTDYVSHVYICPINIDGTFGTCVTNSTLGEPVTSALGY